MGKIFSIDIIKIRAVKKNKSYVFSLTFDQLVNIPKGLA